MVKIDRETIKQHKLYHKSNPAYRDSILENGLIPSIGNSYREMGGIVPKVFAYNSNDPNLYDSTWDDDIYEIDVSNLEQDFFIDSLYENDTRYLCTLLPIPATALILIYQGTGEDSF